MCLMGSPDRMLWTLPKDRIYDHQEECLDVAMTITAIVFVIHLVDHPLMMVLAQSVGVIVLTAILIVLLDAQEANKCVKKY